MKLNEYTAQEMDEVRAIALNPYITKKDIQRSYPKLVARHRGGLQHKIRWMRSQLDKQPVPEPASNSSSVQAWKFCPHCGESLKH